MSKTSNDHRPLTPLADNDLDAVSGGIFSVNDIIANAAGGELGSALDKVAQPEFFGWFYW